jgi:hypothetical protein
MLEGRMNKAEYDNKRVTADTGNRFPATEGQRAWGITPGVQAVGELEASQAQEKTEASVSPVTRIDGRIGVVGMLQRLRGPHPFFNVPCRSAYRVVPTSTHHQEYFISFFLANDVSMSLAWSMITLLQASATRLTTLEGTPIIGSS